VTSTPTTSAPAAVPSRPATVTRSLATVAAFRLMGMLLSVATTSLLARLLEPADFGVMDMMGTLVALFTTASDLGLSAATVQRKEVSHAQVSTLFWLNTLMGGALWLGCVAAGPALAWFYHEPRLVPVAAVMGTAFLFSGLGAQPMALLHRSMSFGRMGIAETLPPLVGLALALVIAVSGGGYWALVANFVGAAVVRTAGYFVASRFRPTRPRRGTGVRTMLRFGGYLVAFNLLNFVIRNLDYVLLGRLWGGQELAFYVRAYWLFSLPLLFNRIGDRVALPVLSRYQEDAPMFQELYGGLFQAVALTTAAASAFVFAHQDLTVRFFLGPKWLPSLPSLRWLAVLGLIHPFLHTTGLLYTSKGRSRTMFRWALFAAMPVSVAIALGVREGGPGIARNFTLTWLVLCWLGFYIAYRTTGIRALQVLRAARAPVLVTASSVFGSWVVTRSLPSSTPVAVQFLIAAATMALLHGVLVVRFLRRAELLHVWRSARSQREPTATSKANIQGETVA